MLGFIGVIHIVVSLILIVLVLLQDSKGGAMGMLGGGGGNQSVFGSTGAVSFLVKATRFIAIIFAATSITLAYMTTNQDKSVLDAEMMPAQQAPATDLAPSKIVPKDSPAAEEAPSETEK